MSRGPGRPRKNLLDPAIIDAEVEPDPQPPPAVVSLEDIPLESVGFKMAIYCGSQPFTSLTKGRQGQNSMLATYQPKRAMVRVTRPKNDGGVFITYVPVANVTYMTLSAAS